MALQCLYDLLRASDTHDGHFALMQKNIEEFVARGTAHARPFPWTAIADPVVEKVEKTCGLINATEHYESRRLLPVPSSLLPD
jgi:hypothetical protein